eukprot:GGOE01001266.1.p1 GENE.GGOE01001266.1~~GGOE01001266.1.p1  ORF type:complete len:697 (+),score=165.07 GGOE01001266.1:136-2226(+)
MGEDVKQALRSLLASHDGYLEAKAGLWQRWAREEVAEYDAAQLTGAPSVAHWRREFWESGNEDRLKKYVAVVTSAVRHDAAIMEILKEVRRHHLEVGVAAFAEWDLQKDVDGTLFAQAFLEAQGGLEVRYALLEGATEAEASTHDRPFTRLPPRLLRSESVGDMVRRMRFLDDMWRWEESIVDQLRPQEKRTLDAQRARFLHTYALASSQAESAAQRPGLLPSDIAMYGTCGELVPEVEPPSCTLAVVVHAVSDVPATTGTLFVRMTVADDLGPLADSNGSARLQTRPSSILTGEDRRCHWEEQLLFPVQLKRAIPHLHTRHGLIPWSPRRGMPPADLPFVRKVIPVPPPYHASAPELALQLEVIHMQGSGCGAIIGRAHTVLPPPRGDGAWEAGVRRSLPLADPDGRLSATELHITLRYPHFPPAALPTEAAAFRQVLESVAGRWRVLPAAEADTNDAMRAAVEHGLAWHPTDPDVLAAAAEWAMRCCRRDTAHRLLHQSLFYRQQHRVHSGSLHALADHLLDELPHRISSDRSPPSAALPPVSPAPHVADTHKVRTLRRLLGALARSPLRPEEEAALTQRPPTPEVQPLPLMVRPQSDAPFRHSSKWQRWEPSRPSDVMIRDVDLHRKFMEYDVDANGFLSHTQFLALFRSLEPFGAEESEGRIRAMLKPYHQLGSDLISYEEYCILMLQVARR